VACLGQDPNYHESAKVYLQFVLAWSGGASGVVLDQLETYERSLAEKRTIQLADWKRMSETTLVEAPLFIPAMVKCALSSPQDATHNGSCVMFGASDYASLAPQGRNRKKAAEAQALMHSAREYLEAYFGHELGEAFKTKVLATLEVRCVMFVLGKTSRTRRILKSLQDIARAFADEIKVQRAPIAIPHFQYIDAELEEETSTPGASVPKLQELDLEGLVPDQLLKERGFDVGVIVCEKTKKEQLEDKIPSGGEKEFLDDDDGDDD